MHTPPKVQLGRIDFYYSNPDIQGSIGAITYLYMGRTMYKGREKNNHAILTATNLRLDILKIQQVI